jgi:hypothetical protein
MRKYVISIPDMMRLLFAFTKNTHADKKLFAEHPNHSENRARPTNGSDRGSLRSHDLTLFVMWHLLSDEI